MSLPEATLSGRSTCDVCDALKGDSTGALRVLPPGYASFGGRTAFAGPVRTVRCFEDNTSVKALLESPGHGAVLVVDGGGSLRRALVGGNIAAAAARNGWAGMLVHGAVRDVAELAACDVGLRALALVPLPTERLHPGEVDVPLQIQQVWVRPGDHLVADADGIVVLDHAPQGTR
ncbi:MAG: ribonuclease E activity regulator RraA [Rubrivivax sp.]